jgi:hypothetical protein
MEQLVRLHGGLAGAEAGPEQGGRPVACIIQLDPGRTDIAAMVGVLV